MLFSQDIFSSMISGTLTQIITNPIWVGKTRLQSQKLHNIDDYKHIFDAINKIFKNEGVYGLFKGLVPSVFGVMHFVIYMPLYDYFNRIHIQYYKSEQNEGEFYKIIYILVFG